MDIVFDLRQYEPEHSAGLDCPTTLPCYTDSLTYGILPFSSQDGPQLHILKFSPLSHSLV